jgi:hypothetical protein
LRPAKGSAEAARRALALARARDAAPRCGALARSTGQPCRKIPIKGRTRCANHGGLTPRGAEWGRPQIANKTKSVRKMERKLADLERRSRAEAKRRGLSVSEYRLTHERGLALPRSRKEREAVKRNSAAIAALLSKPDPPPSPELAALNVLLDEARKLAEALERSLAHDRETDIFS